MSFDSTVTGLLVLLYGVHLTRIVTIRRSQVDTMV